MTEKTSATLQQLDHECIYALVRALEATQKVVSDRIDNKMSTARMSAVAREIKELIKVVSICNS